MLKSLAGNHYPQGNMLRSMLFPGKCISL